MQQELIEMLEEIISYVEVWHKEDQDVLDKAEALVEKAKNNVPAGPVYQLAKLGGPTETAWIDVTQEVYEDAGFYKDDFKRRILSATPAATEQAVPSGEVVAWMVYGNYTRQPFGMLCSAEAYMRGLLKSDPDGGYHIRPLRYATPATAPAQEFNKSVADAEIKALYVESQGSDKGWLGIEGSYFIGGVVAAARKQKAAPAPAQEQCNACCGTGRMVRDPDIGTDQECFVCDGTGFLPAQEPVTLTPAEIDRAVLEATGFDGFGTQPMNTHDTRNIGLEVIAALRAKEKK